MLSFEILNFLSELKVNNNRDWFLANKKRYDMVKAEFEQFVSQLILTIGTFDNDIKYLELKDCTYRINRDVRFSNDKSPYKTHIGAYLAKGGKKSPYAGYYVHIEPGNCFLGGGIYMPLPENLKKIRQGICDNIDEFNAIIHNNSFKKYFQNIEGEKLKSFPKDFPKDEKFDIIKNKSFFVMRPINEETIGSNNYITEIAATFKILKPYNDFMISSLID